jgi:hypothetical protein
MIMLAYGLDQKLESQQNSYHPSSHSKRRPASWHEELIFGPRKDTARAPRATVLKRYLHHSTHTFEGLSRSLRGNSDPIGREKQLKNKPMP